MSLYLLSIYQPDGGPPSSEILEPIMRDVVALQEEMKQSGVWVFGGGLDASGPNQVARLQAGDIITTDGPYLEGKEHLGGFSVVDVPDLDSAMAWAKKLARATTLPIEVRRFVEGSGN